MHSNFLWFRVQDFPSSSTLSFDLSLFEVVGNVHVPVAFPEKVVSGIYLQGQYKGKFRTYSVGGLIPSMKSRGTDVHTHDNFVQVH